MLTVYLRSCNFIMHSIHFWDIFSCNVQSMLYMSPNACKGEVK